MYKTTFIYETKQQPAIEDSFILSLFSKLQEEPIVNHSIIKTYEIDSITANTINRINNCHVKFDTIREIVSDWFIHHPDFLENKEAYYTNFRIPKKKGGYREIHAPKEDLKYIQQIILSYLVDKLQMLPNNAAHAYIKQRSTLTMALQHQKNNCIIKMDLKDFFDSINEEILRQQLSNFEPIVALNTKMPIIDWLIKLACKDGHLVQGNPLSPFLSNIIMIDFDYKLTKMLGKEIPYYTYTRYADDIYLSHSTFCKPKKVVEAIDNLLKVCYNNSIKLNKTKTSYLKCTSKCYITGIKLNKDHQLTFGHEHKKELKLRLYNLFVNYQNGSATQEETWEVLGIFSYMKMIEPDYANYLATKLLRKFNSQAETLYKHFKFN